MDRLHLASAGPLLGRTDRLALSGGSGRTALPEDRLLLLAVAAHASITLENACLFDTYSKPTSTGWKYSTRSRLYRGARRAAKHSSRQSVPGGFCRHRPRSVDWRQHAGARSAFRGASPHSCPFCHSATVSTNTYIRRWSAPIDFNLAHSRLQPGAVITRGWRHGTSSAQCRLCTCSRTSPTGARPSAAIANFSTTFRKEFSFPLPRAALSKSTIVGSHARLIAAGKK